MLKPRPRPAQDSMKNALSCPQWQSREAGSCLAAKRPCAPRILGIRCPPSTAVPIPPKSTAFDPSESGITREYGDAIRIAASRPPQSAPLRLFPSPVKPARQAAALPRRRRVVRLAYGAGGDRGFASRHRHAPSPPARQPARQCLRELPNPAYYEVEVAKAPSTARSVHFESCRSDLRLLKDSPPQATAVTRQEVVSEARLSTRWAVRR